MDRPLTLALERLGEEGWTDADLLLVSDGEFPVPSQLEARVKSARDRGEARLHGLLVGGQRGRNGLAPLCDDVHVFTDWAQVRVA